MSSHLSNMKAVLRRTGLTAETLRAWERRYQAVTPPRSDSGRRLYSETDISRLQMLAELVRAGHAIGSIARLPDADLRPMVARGRRESASSDLTDYTESLLLALALFDLRIVRQWLARIRYESSPKEFLFNLMPKLLERVGDMVVLGTLSVAQQHAISEILQNQLRQVYDSLEFLDGTRRPGRSLLFATPEGQLHEVGLALAAILARYQGFTVHYLGPNLPAKDLILAAKRLRPQAVVLSLMDLPPRPGEPKVEHLLKSLSSALPAGCDLWIGGSGAKRLSSPRLRGKVFIFEEIVDYEQKIARL